MSLVVAKFGGTSVADYAAMNRCADIILANRHTRVVVVSASSGVTNLLVELTQANVNDKRRLALLTQIGQIQYDIVDQLDRPQDVAAGIDKLLSRMSVLSDALVLDRSKAIIDELLSMGEQCSSLLFSAVIREKGTPSSAFDVRQVLRTDSHFGRAEPQIEQIASLGAEHLAPLLVNEVIVTQGFIGADDQGRTTTLGRGGSDYSAALLGRGLKS